MLTLKYKTKRFEENIGKSDDYNILISLLGEKK